MKKLALHWKILLGMFLGVLFAILLIQFDWGKGFILDWIKPFGNIFINLLKLIAVPLILASLIKGVSDLKDISKLSQMGGRTIGLYILTTILAVSIGLIVVNVIKPGSFISEETRIELVGNYSNDANSKIQAAENQKSAGPLQALEDIVPSNIVKAASDNGNMLQVIFFAVFFGIALILIPQDQSQPVKAFFDGFNEAILKMIDIIMLGAPYGVFALMGKLALTLGVETFSSVVQYFFVVLVVLLIHAFIVYPILLKVFSGLSPLIFIRKMRDVQLFAFSTASSNATLPITIEASEHRLGVDNKIASFTLPLGATINMDGTAIMQGVATVFIAQVFGIELTLTDYAAVVVTATLASIGTAGVPGVGLIMLAMVLNQVGLPVEGIALIIGVDRLLDMVRTAVNVTGDCVATVVIAKSEGEFNETVFNNTQAGKVAPSFDEQVHKID